MYREPCASADGVGSPKPTSDEVGEENGERSSFDEGWGPFDKSRRSIDERWRPFDESRGSIDAIDENIARLFECANAHRANCD
jgi:hypothetical protein